MKKKIVVFFICMLLVVIAFPITTAKNQTNTTNPVYQDRQVFNNCYIELTGSIYTQWKICFLKPFGTYYSTVFFWHLELQPNAEITIYTEENGEILYQYQGERQIRILRFRGIYIPTREDIDGPLNVDISGKVSIIITKDIRKEPSNFLLTEEKKGLDNRDAYSNCYIELSGYMHDDWPAIIKLPNMLQILWIKSSENDIIFGTYSYILFENDAEITIYSEQNGDVLWQHQGEKDPLLTIVGFRGTYDHIDTEDELPHITMSGDTLFSSIKLGNYG
jgi:hypothetical protein